MSEGPGVDWNPPLLRDPILDGRPLPYASVQWAQDGGGVALIRNAAGGHRAQRLYRGGSAPASLRPKSGTLSVLPLVDEADYNSLQAMTEAGNTVDLFPCIPHVDVFDLVEGQTHCSPSRRLPWGVTGVSTGSHPVQAWLDGVAQTVIYDADPEPAAGEIGVVDADGAQWQAFRAPAATAGQVLRVRYFPLYRVALTVSWEYAAHNDLRGQFQVVESLEGRWD